MINIAFDNTGKKLSSINLRSIPSETLLAQYPNATIVQEEYGVVQKMRAPITLVNGVITEAPLPTQAEIDAIEAEEVLRQEFNEEVELTRIEIEAGVKDKSITSPANIKAKFNRGA